MNKEIMPTLPKNWIWTRLGEISELIRGVTYKKVESSKKPKHGYLPILRANNINKDLEFIDLVYVPQKKIKREQYVKANDILIAMSSGSKHLVGKAAQAVKDFNGGFGTFCGLIRAFTGSDKRFLGLFFQGPYYRNEIAKLSLGVNINNLRREHIELMTFSLPPLPEQHRIVAKIEELFAKLDAGIEALRKIKAQLKRYRQAVLKHAFEGKLTEEWRLPAGRQEKNGVEIIVENFSGKPIPKCEKHFVYVLECEDKSLYKGYTKDLRRRIKEHIEGIGSEWTKTHYPVALIHFEEFTDEKEAIEKERYFKSGIGREWLKELQRQKELEYNVKTLLEHIKEERKQKDKYKKMPPVDTSNLPKLPEGWIWMKFEDIGEVNPRFSKEGIAKDIEVTFLPMRCVEGLTGKMDLSITKKLSKVMKGYTPFKNGDLLFAKITPCMENGKVAIADKLTNGIGFGSTEFHVIRLSEEVPREFFFYYMIQESFRKEAKRKMKGTAGQLRVPTDYIRQVPIPCASLHEQSKIIEEIERRFSVADVIEKTVEQSLKQAERLRQSILKRAFEGRLVQQDPNDEHAEKLLERIKLEKAKFDKEKSSKKIWKRKTKQRRN